MALCLTTWGVEYWVSPTGGDVNPGTREKPFANLTRAREAVRQRAPGTPATVWLQAGEYPQRQSLLLEAADSGTAQAPVLWSGVVGQKVSLTGGVRLPKTWFAKPKDPTVLERIIDRRSRDLVLAADLRANGITEYGEHSRHGFLGGVSNRAGRVPPAELSYGGERLRVARWPNPNEDRDADLDRFQKGRRGVVARPKKAVLDAGPTARSNDFFDRGGTFRFTLDRPRYWAQAKDIWLDGVLGWSWEWTYNQVERIDPGAGTITMRYGEASGIVDTYSANFFFFENLLEELDEPGEYYLDRAQGILYLMPPADFAQASKDLVLSQLAAPLIRVRGASNVCVREMILEGGRADGILVEQGEALRFERLEVRGFAQGGITLLRGSGHVVSACHVHHVGETGISLSGGSAATLEAGRSVVEGCHIHDFAQYTRVYKPAVSLNYLSCGNRVARNHIHHGPHLGIVVYGNDHVIETNEIHDVLLEFTDMGAIYGNSGARPLDRGIIIRGNYIHQLGLDAFSHGQNGVYPDNGSMGWLVEGNVFARIGGLRDPATFSAAVNINAGAWILTRSNVFIDCSMTAKLSSHAGASTSIYAANQQAWRKTLGEGAAQKYPKHFAQYPELSKFWEEPRQFPTSCTFEGNLIINPQVPLQAAKGSNHVLAEGAYDECRTLQVRGNRWLTNASALAEWAAAGDDPVKQAALLRRLAGFPLPPIEAMPCHEPSGPTGAPSMGRTILRKASAPIAEVSPSSSFDLKLDFENESIPGAWVLDKTGTLKASLDGEGPHRGKLSLRLAVDANAESVRSAYRIIKLPAARVGTNALFGVWMRTRGLATDEAWISVLKTPRSGTPTWLGGNVERAANMVPSQEWRRHEFEGVVGLDLAHLVFYVRIAAKAGAGATVWVDDLEISGVR